VPELLIYAQVLCELCCIKIVTECRGREEEQTADQDDEDLLKKRLETEFRRYAQVIPSNRLAVGCADGVMQAVRQRRAAVPGQKRWCRVVLSKPSPWSFTADRMGRDCAMLRAVADVATSMRGVKTDRADELAMTVLKAWDAFRARPR
jgi:hypothetical protein